MSNPNRSAGRRLLLPGLSLVVIAVAAVVLAVTLRPGGTDDTASPEPGAGTSATPPGTASATPTPTGTGAPLTTTIYFAGATARGAALYPEKQQVPSDDPVVHAVQAAIDGRSEIPGRTSYWPADTVVVAVRPSDTPIAIDVELSGTGLGALPAGVSRTEADLAVQQVVYTALAAARDDSVSAVRFVVDGAPATALLGTPTAYPVAAEPADRVLAPVQILAPAQDAVLGSPFTVSGQAATFEATVVWELERAGTVVDHGFATAQECCTLSPYSFSVDVPPGHYTLVVHDTDESGQNRPVNSDRREITVE